MKIQNLIIFVTLVLREICLSEVINNENGLNETLIELPPDMIICSRNVTTSTRAECIKNSINHLLPLLKDGYPPLDFPPLDPFYVNTTYIEYDQSIITSKLNVTNIEVAGLSTAEVKTVRHKINSTHLNLIFDLHMPVVTLEADYTGTTRFNDVTVHSGGHSIVHCYETIASIKFNGAIETMDDEEDYMIIKSAKIVNVSMKQMKLNGTGLLPDPDLNEVVVEILNEVWETIFKQVFPKFKSSWDPIVLELVNRFFGNVPFRMLMNDE